MKTQNPVFAGLVMCLALSFSTARAQDWPQWRGANRDGKASFKAPANWPKELSPKWKVTVGDGVSTPALVGDKLYVFARQEGGEVLLCLDAANGKEVWKSEKYDVLPADGPARGFSGPRSSPAVGEGKVVTLGLRGMVVCYDASSGKKLWQNEDFKGEWPRFFTASSPLIADGMCIAQLGGGKSGGVIAYDLATGAEKWKWAGEGPAYASATLMTVGGTKMVVAETDSKIVGIGTKDGKLLWEIPFAVPGRGYNACSPIVEGDTLIYGGSGRGFTAAKIEKSGDDFSVKELWKNTDNSVQFNTPVVKNGDLYGLTAGNDFFCITKDGKTAWTAPLSGGGDQAQGQGRRRGGMGRGGFGEIVDAGSVMLALTPASELVVFQPNNTSYSEVARIKVAESGTYASPVASGNRIFVKDQNDVMLYVIQ